jgi:1,4-alpha-glucan branching enzyme
MSAHRPSPVTRLLTHEDLEGFTSGKDARAYEKLGARLGTKDGALGAFFAVWAPEASFVEVIGDFNGWPQIGADAHARLEPVGTTGVWQGFVRGVERGHKYKYRIVSRQSGAVGEKADPYGLLHETAPATASIVWSLEHTWHDAEWMASRGRHQALDAPMSIYELHLGSWRRVPEEGHRSLSYREIAAPLAAHVLALGFTHVELMPIMEHPFFGSWGYEVTGYFAPTHRYGKPDELMFLIDHLHAHGIGVILDWVPAHFPGDAHALANFDGTHLYEHADPRQGFHPDWNSFIFNYGRHEVRSFLLSSAMFWLDAYHLDGLRVDGVASMLQLDYSRKPGEWIPNKQGGRENLEAVDLVRTLNEQVYLAYPDVQVIAEESTAWPLVSKPTSVGGLGFGLKWDMGWMHDTLAYFARDPLWRGHHQNELTFRSMYAYSESFVLPLSHDEVVYGKGSLLRKMPGDEWQRFANLRLLYSYMWSQPGKKLLFMGGELGQWSEWNHDSSLDWHLAEQPLNAGVGRVIEALNRHYKDEPALHEGDSDAHGFVWIDGSNARESVITYMRRGHDENDVIVVLLNFTPTPRPGYRVGVPRAGRWRELFNSDAREYGGSGQGNMGGVDSTPVPYNGRRQSIVVNLPPLAAVFLKRDA